MEYLGYVLLVSLSAIAGALLLKLRNQVKSQMPDLSLYLNDFRIMDLYDAVNHSIRTNQDKLTYVVDDMNIKTFPMVYHSLKQNSIQVTINSREREDGRVSEYLSFDFSTYSGPRNKDLIPIWDRRVLPKATGGLSRSYNSTPFGRPRSQSSSAPKRNYSPSFSFFKKEYTNNVIEVDFKNKRVKNG